MAMPLSPKAVLAVTLASAVLAGCSQYVKRDEFDATVADLRAADARLEAQIQALSDKHDALVTQVAGRTRVDTAAYFAVDDATLSEDARPLLDDFANAIRNSHSGALITIEGFTDPSGSPAYNKKLGQRRADAARDYLVDVAGLPAEQVRAVSYGEDENRQVRPGATGVEGQDNRRIALVVDYAGPKTASVM
ncbi:OmpA family protein [Marilutibacter alkalisoli]|uniref:OmpA family protein n=1 Tax=Marilutibacter alkalisoli TaxID=2591633 RepID=A0A514BSA3_9GAMM|nr:OmpA family protein [Lysobacter alkalisoli]QDH69899.1 OmpA family protein [Lysobacter alkalisoli]